MGELLGAWADAHELRIAQMRLGQACCFLALCMLVECLALPNAALQAQAEKESRDIKRLSTQLALEEKLAAVSNENSRLKSLLSHKQNSQTPSPTGVVAQPKATKVTPSPRESALAAFFGDGSSAQPTGAPVEHVAPVQAAAEHTPATSDGDFAEFFSRGRGPGRAATGGLCGSQQGARAKCNGGGECSFLQMDGRQQCPQDSKYIAPVYSPKPVTATMTMIHVHILAHMPCIHVLLCAVYT